MNWLPTYDNLGEVIFLSIPLIGISVLLLFFLFLLDLLLCLHYFFTEIYAA